MRSPILFQHRMQMFKRVINLVPPCLAPLSQDNLSIERVDLKKGTCTKKAVTTDPFAPHDALKQERILVVLQPAVRADRGQRVADKLPKNRDEIHPFRQLPKSGEVRSVRGHVVESLSSRIPEGPFCRVWHGIGWKN